ncbi:MAG: hypothetical protein EON47_21160, partial [Acetobacteraceae bacterium]
MSYCAGAGGGTVRPARTWMVRLPPGSFMMGQGARDTAALPVRRVTLQGFAIGQFPVTVAE